MANGPAAGKCLRAISHAMLHKSGVDPVFSPSFTKIAKHASGREIVGAAGQTYSYCSVQPKYLNPQQSGLLLHGRQPLRADRRSINAVCNAVPSLRDKVVACRTHQGRRSVFEISIFRRIQTCVRGFCHIHIFMFIFFRQFCLSPRPFTCVLFS